MSDPDPRLSVSLPYWQDRDPLDALAVARAADDLGYDRLWVGEMATFDAFALAAVIGHTSGRIPLCVGPLAVDVRTPATIAMGAATVAALTGRRVDVALGSSSAVVVGDWHGRRRQRTATHLEETAHIVGRLLDGDKVDFNGTTEQIRGYRLRLPPTPAELTLAAFGEQALTAAARIADRVVLNLVTPKQVARCTAMVTEAAVCADRAAPKVSVWVTAATDPTAEQLTTMRRGVVGYLRAPGYDAMFTDAGFGEVVALAHSGVHPREVLAAVPDELPAAIGLFGDATTVADRAKLYRAAGADELVVVPATTGDDPAGHHTLDALAKTAHD